MADSHDWNRNVAGGFGTHVPEDEFFHGTGPQGDSLTETWYWGFHIPSAKINCYAYCWTHPNLKVATSGLFIYQGRKRQHLACELFELRDFMSLSVVGDGREITLPNSMQVHVIEPFQHIRLTFDDPQRQTSVDVQMKAVAPPIMRANNKHFEQLMHVTGHLVLRGKRYVVDCHQVRDRSWGELRPENHAPGPPYTWVTGVFGPSFAFNIGAHDDPARHPDWQGLFDVNRETVFKDGWIQIDGTPQRLAKASLVTRREQQLLQPLTVEAEFMDAAGTAYQMTGDVVALTPWSGWSNMNAQLGLIEWHWNGRTGYGEMMDCHWNDYVQGMANRA